MEEASFVCYIYIMCVQYFTGKLVHPFMAHVKPSELFSFSKCIQLFILKHHQNI